MVDNKFDQWQVKIKVNNKILLNYCEKYYKIYCVCKVAQTQVKHNILIAMNRAIGFILKLSLN